MHDGRGIKSACRFPGCALRRKNWLVRGALPGAERQIDSRRGEGKGRYEGEQDQREKGKERFLLAKTARRGSGLASLEMTGRAVPANNHHKNSLLRFGRFGRIELLGADDAFAFFDEDYLVGFDVFERFDEAARPADFEELDGFGFADAEVDAEIVLGKIAAAAADFVNLRMQTLLAGKMRDALDARADAAAIGSRADGCDCDPLVAVS